jgi:hypothetical protein
MEAMNSVFMTCHKGAPLGNLRWTDSNDQKTKSVGQKRLDVKANLRENVFLERKSVNFHF